MIDQTEIKSNLVFRSIGYVAANKERDTNIIEVYPFEIMPDLNVELTSDTVELTKQGVSFNDKKLYTTTVKKAMSFPAEWIGRTHHGLSPDVRWREQVRLFQAGDSDKWYWESMGRDDSLRRLESFLWYINANPEAPDTETTTEHLYRFYVSSHDKLITLTTTTANGEFTTYEFTFNLEDGYVKIADGEGNHILLNSADTVIQLFNKEETEVTLDKTNILLKSNDRIDHKTKDYKLECETATVECKTYSLNVSKTATVDCKTYGLNASESATIDSPTITFKGTVNQSGGNFGIASDLNVGGKAKMSGEATMSSLKLTDTLSSSSGANFASNVTAPNI